MVSQVVAQHRALTATEVLEAILARDGAAVSATTAQATGASPEAQLHDAVTRYADAVTRVMFYAPYQSDPEVWLPIVAELQQD